jgi:molybdopterin-containing oxidoreductase family iron-sulfur binding subunit
MSARNRNPDIDRELRRKQLALAIGRRDLLAGALGLAGLSACTRAPREEIVPYVVQPPEVRPGRARFYASAFVLDGYATGVLVESHEGRPTKVEGNPDHPASLGATGVFEQAAVLSLYDPARLRSSNHWLAALAEVTARPWAKNGGEGLHLLLEPTSSPSLADALTRLRARFPRARVWFDRALGPDPAWEGARIAFGHAAFEPRWDVEHADVIVALDADIFADGPQALAISRGYGRGRETNRLYAVGPLVTPTSMAADHVLPVRAHDVVAVAAALAHALGAVPVPGPLRERHAPWAAAVAKDLKARRGLVMVGEGQPPIVHALAHAMNATLSAPVAIGPSPIFEAGEASHDRRGLFAALTAGQVDTLLVCEANPAYTAPELPLARAGLVACLASYENETTKHGGVKLAAAHVLESWGDARAFDGTLSVVQPLIQPLHDGATTLEVVAALAGDSRSGHEIVRARFEDDRAWRAALKKALVEGTAFASVTPPLDREAIRAALSRVAPPPSGLELVARPDPCLHDGRFADNTWLLELPQPGTTLTWSNAAVLSRATAHRLGIDTGEEIELTVAGRSVRAPALIAAGHADDSIALSLGWGRKVGTNAFALGAGAQLGLDVKKVGPRRELALTQLHRSLEGRDDEIARHGTSATLTLARKKEKRSLTLYEPHAKKGRQWGMAIDLSKCTGCNACVVACQAENNVPSVGEDGIRMGRQMHWLRLDTYDADDGPVVQPMLCQHCEKAPCEYVCPVNATVHSPDGLNEMVYNRCVGTRFCSNNCPYKVRRFNWFDYHQNEHDLTAFGRNPDVTVRERGVMEKCTFCVQRIREGEIREARGEKGAASNVKTACQQSCATGAIVFGDLSDPSSEVAKLHASERAYGALHELGTEPRVRYLGKVRNRNPEVA